MTLIKMSPSLTSLRRIASRTLVASSSPLVVWPSRTRPTRVRGTSRTSLRSRMRAPSQGSSTLSLKASRRTLLTNRTQSRSQSITQLSRVLKTTPRIYFSRSEVRRSTKSITFSITCSSPVRIPPATQIRRQSTRKISRIHSISKSSMISMARQLSAVVTFTTAAR